MNKKYILLKVALIVLLYVAVVNVISLYNYNKLSASSALKNWKILERSGSDISFYLPLQNKRYAILKMDPKKEVLIRAASFSYSLSKIAYVSNTRKGFYVYAVNPTDATDRKLLFPNPKGYVEKLTWSPDGKKIAFVGKVEPKEEPEFDKNDPTTWTPRYNSLYSYDMDTKSIQLLVNEGVREISNQCWSLDSKKIVYENIKGNIYIYDFDLNTSDLFIEKADCATWSPNGKWIAYAQGKVKEENYFIMSPDKTQKELLIKRANLWQNIRLIRSVMGYLIWSPDSQYVYYDRDVGIILDAEQPRPFIMNVATRKEYAIK